MKIIWSIILLFISIVTTVAQGYNYTLISTLDGLPSNHVYTVLLDQKGYLWFATDRGVAKYDGYNMKVFTTADGLASNDIWDLWEDSHGRIWLSSFAKKINYIEADSIKTAWDRNQNSQIEYFFERDGIVLTSMNSFYSHNKWEPIVSLKDTTIPFRIIILEDFKRMIIDQNNNTYIETIKDDEITSIKIKTTNTLDFNDISSLKIIPSKNILYYVKNAYLYKWNYIDQTIDSIYIEQLKKYKNAEVIIKKNSSGIQLCMPSGYIKFDSNLNIKSQFFTNNELGMKFGDYIYGDRKDNIYIIKKGKAVGYLSNSRTNSKHFVRENNKVEVTFMAMDIDNKLIVGYQDGSVLVKENNQLVEKIKHQKVFDNKVISIVQMGEHKFVFFQNSKLKIVDNDFQPDLLALSQFNKGSSMFKTNPFLKKQMNINFEWRKSLIHSGFFSGSKKDIYYNKTLNWISLASSSYNGMFELGNHHINKINYYSISRNYATLISNDSIIYYGGNEGLTYVYQDSIYHPSPLYPQHLKSINKLLIDPFNNLWVGTDGFGVYCYQKNKEPIIVKGCEYDIILDMSLSPNGDIWISTHNGVKQIRMRDSLASSAIVIAKYTQLDGLSTNASSRIVVTDSTLYAGSILGIDELDISKEKPKETKPQLYMEQVRVNGILKSKKKVYMLAYNENNINISYSGISYKSKKPLSYTYTIEGYTQDAIVSHDNEIQLDHLTPGKYNLKLYASDTSGMRSKVKQLQFIIKKPWFKKWWVYVLYSLLLGLVIYKIVKYYQNIAQNKESIKKRIAELELQALQSQMNPHFIFNALGAIQQYRNEHNTQKAEDYFNGFARLMRLYLESSKNAEVSLKDEIELIKIYVSLEELRFKEKFEFHITIDPKLEIDYINIPSMILQPFVENAINHGLFHKKGKGNLFIEIKYFNDDNIEIIIKDDGIGRKKSREISRRSKKNFKSRAMQIIEERIEIIDKLEESCIKINIIDLVDQLGKAKGTEIRIIICCNF